MVGCYFGASFGMSVDWFVKLVILFVFIWLVVICLVDLVVCLLSVWLKIRKGMTSMEREMRYVKLLLISPLVLVFMSFMMVRCSPPNSCLSCLFTFMPDPVILQPPPSPPSTLPMPLYGHHKSPRHSSPPLSSRLSPDVLRSCFCLSSYCDVAESNKAGLCMLPAPTRNTVANLLMFFFFRME